MSETNGSTPAALLETTEGKPQRTWFTRLIVHYMRRNRLRRKEGVVVERVAPDEAAEKQQALKAIRVACIKSALSGFATGAMSTGASMITAQTEGVGGIVAVPLAALTIGGEMLYRSILHVDLTWELADIFGVTFDATNERDIWRLYGLAFGTHKHDEESTDPGRSLVHDLSHAEGEQIGEKIGDKVLGESVMRNIVPVVGIVSSAVTNYVVTRRLGDTVRRYMRYERALNDAMSRVSALCAKHMDLVVEGLWFIFTADGKLTPEETVCLAKMLDRLDPVMRKDVCSRFTEDEIDWTERIAAQIPDDLRDAFLHAMEVAAAVDHEVGLPERKILRRIARAFGREIDFAHVSRMVAAIEETGVIDDGKPDVHARRAEHATPSRNGG